jgi:hypothetical protein
MNVKFKFFDTEKWSIFATVNTIIPITLLYIFKIKLDIKTLTLASLIAMMSGNLISKLVFYIFMSLLIYKKNKNYMYTNIVFILSIIIIHFIPLNNKIQKIIIQNNYTIYIFRIIIVLWFLYFFYYLYK